MVGCECVIHQRVNSVLDRSQFLGSSITNDLRDDQILTVRNDLSSHQRCTFDGSTDNGLSRNSLTHDGPNPQWFDLQGLGSTAHESTADYLRWFDLRRLGPAISKQNESATATHQRLYQESQEVLA